MEEDKKIPDDESENLPLKEDSEKADEEKERQSKENKAHNKQLAVILLVSALVIISFLAIYYLVNSSNTFAHNGVDFDILQKGEIKFFHTGFAIHEGRKQVANYNVFIRNDPRDLEKIPLNINGEIQWTDLMAMNSSEPFNCDGDGIIAVANLINVFTFLGTKVGRDENATCDFDGGGRYIYVSMVPGNTSEIVEIGPNCYEFRINDCEILEVTERFMLERLEYTQAKMDDDYKLYYAS